MESEYFIDSHEWEILNMEEGQVVYKWYCHKCGSFTTSMSRKRVSFTDLMAKKIVADCKKQLLNTIHET